MDERSKRNAEDIQKLWGRSSEQGEEIARMDEKLGTLQKGQEDAKQERERQGGVLDRIAAKLDVEDTPHDHSHAGGPPAVSPPAVAPVAAPFFGLGWLKLIAIGAAALLALAGAAAEMLGLTNLLS